MPSADWISLPALVLVLSYMFLLTTIVQTRRRIVQPWHSDALALAMAGIDDGDRDRLEQAKWSRSDSNPFRSAADKVRIGLRKRANSRIVFTSEASI